MAKQPPIIILGAGEQGRVVANILQLQGMRQLFFLDDHRQSEQILGTLADFPQFVKTHHFHVAFGNNQLRQHWFDQLLAAGAIFVSAIHPEAHHEDLVELGQNCMVGAHVYINIGVKIGNNCIVNSGALLEHDTTLEDSVFIGPRACTAGGVRIKSLAMIGMGAMVLDDLVVAEGSVIGAGAVVTKNTIEQGKYMGVPAVLKTKTP